MTGLTLRRWTRALKADGRSDQTVRSYSEGLRSLVSWLPAGTDPLEVTTEGLASFLDHLVATRSRGTAAVRFRALAQFYRWATAQELVPANPMMSLSPPPVPRAPGGVVTPKDRAMLLVACAGNDFLSVRDAALLRLMFEPAGMRSAEVVGMTVGGVELQTQTVTVVGTSRRERSIAFGPQTSDALTRYLAVRAKHPQAHLSALWIAHKGPLTPGGIGQILERRCTQAGIGRVRPQQLQARIDYRTGSR